MKLAQLLNARATCNTQIDRNVTEGIANVSYNEGETPPVDANEALQGALENLDVHLDLSLRVARTNRETTARWGEEDLPIADLIVIRQNLSRKLNILDKFIRTSNVRRGRWGRNELVTVIGLDVANAKRQYEEVAGTLRRLDDVLQEVNWTSEVEG